MKLTKNKILSLIAILFLSLLIVMTGVCPTFVRADDSAVKFDESNVLEDLEDMTLDGKQFSLEEYNFDTKKDTQILSFVEYCYSFYEEKQDDFGFYVYIYNPKGLKFKTDSSLNTIQFATTKDSDSAYTKYILFVNVNGFGCEDLCYSQSVNVDGYNIITIPPTSTILSTVFADNVK